jgi:hypothetical protein
MLGQFTGTQVINDFLLSLLSDAGMNDVSPRVKEQMIDDLNARLQDRFVATIISNLDENKLEEFSNLLESAKDEAKVQSFIDANLPNASQLFAQSMLKFRDDYLGFNQ